MGKNFHQQGIFAGDVMAFDDLRYFTDFLKYFLVGSFFYKIDLNADKSAGMVTNPFWING